MDLVLLVCLASSPATCREERVPVSMVEFDPRACMMGAAPTIAEWIGDHPEWQVSRWKCNRGDSNQLTRNFE